MVEVERRVSQVSEIGRSRSTRSWESTQSALVMPALSITGESILITRTGGRFYVVEDSLDFCERRPVGLFFFRFGKFSSVVGEVLTVQALTKLRGCG